MWKSASTSSSHRALPPTQAQHSSSPEPAAPGAESVNETALRTVQLGVVLILGGLSAIDPFDNQLVHAFLSEEDDQDHGAFRFLAFVRSSACPRQR